MRILRSALATVLLSLFVLAATTMGASAAAELTSPEIQQTFTDGSVPISWTMPAGSTVQRVLISSSRRYSADGVTLDDVVVSAVPAPDATSYTFTGVPVGTYVAQVVVQVPGGELQGPKRDFYVEPPWLPGGAPVAPASGAAVPPYAPIRFRWELEPNERQPVLYLSRVGKTDAQGRLLQRRAVPLVEYPAGTRRPDVFTSATVRMESLGPLSGGSWFWQVDTTSGDGSSARLAGSRGLVFVETRWGFDGKRRGFGVRATNGCGVTVVGSTPVFSNDPGSKLTATTTVTITRESGTRFFRRETVRFFGANPLAFRYVSRDAGDRASKVRYRVVLTNGNQTVVYDRTVRPAAGTC